MHTDVRIVEPACLDRLQNPIKRKRRIKYTCFDVSADYIMLGAVTGSVYVFERSSLDFIGLLTTQASARVCCVSVQRRGQHVVAVGHAQVGRVNVLPCPASSSASSLSPLTTLVAAGGDVTCACWHDSVTSLLYCGTSCGLVVRVTLQTGHRRRLAATTVLQLNVPVCEMLFCHDILLVSTVNFTYLCNLKEEVFAQVGGERVSCRLGVCVWSGGPTTCIYCVRPQWRWSTVMLNGRITAVHTSSPAVCHLPACHVQPLAGAAASPTVDGDDGLCPLPYIMRQLRVTDSHVDLVAAGAGDWLLLLRPGSWRLVARCWLGAAVLDMRVHEACVLYVLLDTGQVRCLRVMTACAAVQRNAPTESACSARDNESQQSTGNTADHCSVARDDEADDSCLATRNVAHGAVSLDRATLSKRRLLERFSVMTDSRASLATCLSAVELMVEVTRGATRDGANDDCATSHSDTKSRWPALESFLTCCAGSTDADYGADDLSTMLSDESDDLLDVVCGALSTIIESLVCNVPGSFIADQLSDVKCELYDTVNVLDVKVPVADASNAEACSSAKQRLITEHIPEADLSGKCCTLSRTFADSSNVRDIQQDDAEMFRGKCDAWTAHSGSTLTACSHCRSISSRLVMASSDTSMRAEVNQGTSQRTVQTANINYTEATTEPHTIQNISDIADELETAVFQSQLASATSCDDVEDRLVDETAVRLLHSWPGLCARVLGRGVWTRTAELTHDRLHHFRHMGRRFCLWRLLVDTCIDYDFTPRGHLNDSHMPPLQRVCLYARVLRRQPSLDWHLAAPLTDSPLDLMYCWRLCVSRGSEQLVLWRRLLLSCREADISGRLASDTEVLACALLNCCVVQRVSMVGARYPCGWPHTGAHLTHASAVSRLFSRLLHCTQAMVGVSSSCVSDILWLHGAFVEYIAHVHSRPLCVPPPLCPPHAPFDATPSNHCDSDTSSYAAGVSADVAPGFNDDCAENCLTNNSRYQALCVCPCGDSLDGRLELATDSSIPRWEHSTCDHTSQPQDAGHIPACNSDLPRDNSASCWTDTTCLPCGNGGTSCGTCIDHSSDLVCRVLLQLGDIDLLRCYQPCCYRLVSLAARLVESRDHTLRHCQRTVDGHVTARALLLLVMSAAGVDGTLSLMSHHRWPAQYYEDIIDGCRADMLLETGSAQYARAQLNSPASVALPDHIMTSLKSELAQLSITAPAMTSSLAHRPLMYRSTADCAVCCLPLDNQHLLRHSGLLVFGCGHAYHTVCLSARLAHCLLCVS